MYGVPAYYIAKAVVDTPIIIIGPMFNAIITYFGIGCTYSASQFFYFYLITFLTSFLASTYGYLLSVLFEKEEDACNMAHVMVLPQVLFGGFFINSKNFPAWISWL